MDWLGTIANISAIATAVIAAGTACWFWHEARSKRRTLERYLEEKKLEGIDKGQRSVLHLMTRLGLTEAEVLQASFRSKKIKRLIKSGQDGLAAQMLLEYTPD